MKDGLDVIIVDDDPDVCEVLADIINRFYKWGNVFVFTDVNEAAIYCLNRDVGIAILVVDVYLGEKSGFQFLDTISTRFATAHEDTIMITGHASDDVVDMCVASNVNHLLEKPVRPFALQLAVRAITSKYLRFAKKLLEDECYSQECVKIIP
jgi:response regulator of citrate/malate metabolism